MDSLSEFTLEDFFYEHEFLPNVINLASSDSLPWAVSELRGRGLSDWNAEISAATFSYPDVKSQLVPGLVEFFNLGPDKAVLPTSGAAEAIAIVMHHLAATGTCGLIGIPS